MTAKKPVKQAKASKADPLFVQYAALDWGQDYSDAFSFVMQHRAEFTPEFFLQRNNRWGDTHPFGLLLVRILVGEEPFTPAVIRRLQGEFAENAEFCVIFEWFGLPEAEFKEKICESVADDPQSWQLMAVVDMFMAMGKLRDLWMPQASE